MAEVLSQLHLDEVEQHLKVGGRQWKVMERLEVLLWRPLEVQGVKGELQEELLQGKGGKVQVDLPWHRALTQESGDEEMQTSELLADRTPTWKSWLRLLQRCLWQLRR